MYITVTVGNRIHQIKSSIYLSGSGDSGEERRGVEGCGRGGLGGERVTLTQQGCERGRGGCGWSGPTPLVACVLGTDKELCEFSFLLEPPVIRETCF